MILRSQAIICAARVRGETGSLVHMLTPDHGLIAAFVAGGRGRHLRPVLMPGNAVMAELRSGGGGRTLFARLELTESRAPLLAEPLPAAAIAWVTALTVATLAERHPYPALYAAITGMLDAICHAPSARGWVPGLLLYEALMLRELGYGGTRAPGRPPTDWPALMAAFDRLGLLVGRYLLADQTRDVMAARGLLRERLARIDGI